MEILHEIIANQHLGQKWREFSSCTNKCESIEIMRRICSGKLFFQCNFRCLLFFCCGMQKWTSIVFQMIEISLIFAKIFKFSCILHSPPKTIRWKLLNDLQRMMMMTCQQVAGFENNEQFSLVYQRSPVTPSWWMKGSN